MEYEREVTDFNKHCENMTKLTLYVIDKIKKCVYIEAKKEHNVDVDKICTYSDTTMFEIYEDDDTNEYNTILLIDNDMFHTYIFIDRKMAELILEVQKGLYY